MARVRANLRRRKVLRYTLGCTGALAAWGALILLFRPGAAQPVVPGERVEGLTDALARSLPPGAPEARFRDITVECGVDFHHMAAARSRVLPEDVGSGCALADLDGDDDLDLFLVGFEPLDPAMKLPGARRGHALYLNDGRGRFTDHSVASGIAVATHGLGVAAGDYDADGDIDLFVACLGPDQLFENLGNATFCERASAAGIAHPGFGSGAAFADYDRDGHLDLCVGHYVEFRDEPQLRGLVSNEYGLAIPFTLNPSSYRPAPNVLYRNRGDGTFEDVTAAAGVANPEGRSLAVAFTDLDGDALPDIYVANDVSDNAYFRNRGDGTFQDASYATCTADHRGAMGLAIGDFDRDLDTDIYITHWIGQENALYECISRRNGLPVYADVADQHGLGAVALDHVGWGTFFFDVDDDGRQDLLYVNGHTLEHTADVSKLVEQRMFLMWNDYPAGFFDITARSGEDLIRPGNYRGAVAGDIDGDGDLDLVVTQANGKARVLANETPRRNHWLAVRVRDGGRNRFAVGARITVATRDSTQTAVVGAQPSYLSAMPFDLRFGLGPHAAADRVEVRFPDGGVKVVESVPADRRIVIER